MLLDALFHGFLPPSVRIRYLSMQTATVVMLTRTTSATRVRSSPSTSVDMGFLSFLSLHNVTEKTIMGAKNSVQQTRLET